MKLFINTLLFYFSGVLLGFSVGVHNTTMLLLSGLGGLYPAYYVGKTLGKLDRKYGNNL